jgi:hypothetical protein
MGMAEQLIDAMLGDAKPAEFNPTEEAAKVVGSKSAPEFAANAGGLGGAAIGAFLGGPVGFAVGGMIGSKIGEKAGSVGSAPAGPGATISGGSVDTSNQPVSDGAISVAQSIQHLAMKGLTNRAAASGRGKTF